MIDIMISIKINLSYDLFDSLVVRVVITGVMDMIVCKKLALRTVRKPKNLKYGFSQTADEHQINSYMGFKIGLLICNILYATLGC